MLINNKCCKNCTERYLGCHDVCPRYQKFKERLDKARAQRNYERTIVSNSWGYMLGRKTRWGK